ncbi:ABC transporter permease [Salinisphaera sp. USBA-960]|uniref:ABC transporter permease n=1 Tax=Salinisphaera orenii TaxID=856731 RepID=UPI000DBE04BB|nr:ABC transporter permease [Salifodinibacter halophilus]NNC25677.1 ABC transporter permease [Salifodinibacter halophilus]
MAITSSNQNAVAVAPAGQRFRKNAANVIKRPEIGSIGGALLVFILFFILAEPFRDPVSWSTILYQSATLGIPAVGVSLLMIGGQFDLSVGVGVTTSSLAAAMFAMQVTGDVWFGIGFALVLSLAIGGLNGFLLVKTGLHSFLVTLSTFLMLQGLNIAITKLVTGNVATGDISILPGFEVARTVFASDFNILGVSVNIVFFYWLLFVALATWVLLRTTIGNWIFAVGGDENSARAVGVPVDKMKIGLYMVVGFFVWFLGMHMLFSYTTVQSGEGVGNELLYIAEAVVGGCLLTGGYGSAVGSAIGAFIFGMTTQGIIYAGWNPQWFMFFVGLMLLLATVFNAWIRRQATQG